MSTSDQNIQLVEEMYRCFNAHDWEAMAALYHDPAEFKDPSFGQEVVQQTRQEIAQKYREMAEIFPDLKDEVIHVYPSGQQHVIVEFISSGTAPDGSGWTLPICTIFEIEDGLIRKDHTYYDRGA